MGVQGLWPLLEPVGRRINIQALAGKRLAVGALLQLLALAIPARASFKLPATFQLPTTARSRNHGLKRRFLSHASGSVARFLGTAQMGSIESLQRAPSYQTCLCVVKKDRKSVRLT